MNRKISENDLKQIRRNIIEMTYRSNGSHVGCSLDIVEILTVLYFQILNIDPKNPGKKDRDRFILSKGHACSALYSVLSQRGFFPKKKLLEYCRDGSKIAAHVTLSALPGIEATSGSLGHGLPIGVGMALALKNNKIKSNIYVLTGDGECLEGSIWEAITFAGYHKLNNLVLIIDNNNLITLGKLSQILSLDPIDKKLNTFGWKTVTVDGHNLTKLNKAFQTKHPNQPLAIIAKTIKGKGVSYMENDYVWHGKCPNEEQYKIAIKELT